MTEFDITLVNKMSKNDEDSWLLSMNHGAGSVVMKQTESYVSLRRELLALRAEYKRVAAPDVARVGEYLQGWDQVTLGETFDEILSLVHSLRGTAAAYGFCEVGAVAGEIEEVLRFVREHQALPAGCDVLFLARRWQAAAVYNQLTGV
ncbi:MAG TPA: Hpt domain-containing protein [Planktothrix sp.]